MKNSYLDYKVFVVPEFNEISSKLSGENQKHILVGFIDENNPALDALLERILTAVKLNIQKDCLTVKRLENEMLPSFSQLIQENTIAKVVLFGISSKDLGLNITPPQYIPLEFNNRTFLFADMLSKINAAENLKKNLWDALRDMFKNI